MIRSSHPSLPLAAVLALAASACGSPRPASFGPVKVDIPVLDTTKAPKGMAKAGPRREAPPPSSAVKESPFPAVDHAALANGVGVDVVTAKSLPLAHVRVLVKAGAGYGALPATGAITAQLLKDGGTRGMSSADVLRKVETVGADIGVRADNDAIVLSLTVPSDKLGEAFGVLGEVTRFPRFDDGELQKLKNRMSDEAKENARSSGMFMATRALFRELYGAKGPYATMGLLASDIAKVGGREVRDFHRAFFVPGNVTVVITGAVEPADAKALVEKAFGDWKGDAPPAVEVPAPKAPEKRRVIVCHREGSAQSDAFVAMLAPARGVPEWPAIRVSNQVLGGGVASRLFLDVREQRSLAYRTSAQILELAKGPQPLIVYAGTETKKTDQAVRGLLDNLDRIAKGDVREEEAASARRYLSDIFAIRMETLGSVADMITNLRVLGLPDGYYDAYRTEVRGVNADGVNGVARTLYPTKNALVLVAGDAGAIADGLAAFGDVTVVDPEKDFAVVRTVAAKP